MITAFIYYNFNLIDEFVYTRHIRSSGGVVVKLLACGARGPGSISGLAATISEIGYLLLPRRDMAERSLKRRKSSKQPTTTRQLYIFYFFISK